MPKSKDRCWPGYEAVPGKAKNEQGSCRKKAASKSTAGEKKFQAKRERQLETWKKAHPESPRKAAQHLGKPSDKPAASKKKKRAPAAKKASAKRARRTTSR